ncbi:hypothetical protein EUA06_11655 [Nocardioides glacieisoli]|uniref:JAB domain-containing protein n=1 Tax=Nocardioides glacieisoli TaxID=1168730 RepID=A0A4Q2RMK3_9ACTN|nr:ThiF family adenylyltransferase [Nocardioides glacieisoli]RYB90060.1 hypothetical protein EUA06_11655 [Nocardioides glacieisoli]
MADPVDHERAHSSRPAEPLGSRAPAPTLGPELAALQLAELAAISAGGLEIITESTEARSAFVLSLATDGIAAGPGVRLRSRERFRVYVGDKFPFTPPKVFADHQRWAGSPHVQWGTFLCLYAAESVEWNSADGMRGFVERLLAWLENAAAGTLDPDDRPLHPPSTATSPAAGRLVVRPDLADRVPWAKESSGPAGTPSATQATAEVAYGWCVHDGSRFEILEWLTLVETYDKVLQDGLIPLDERGRRFMVIPVVMMDTHLGWEYPKHAADLAHKLAEAGYAPRDLLDVVVFASRMNRLMRMIERDAALDTDADSDAGTGGDTEFDVDSDPLILGLATPGRRVESDRLAHIVAWRFTGIGVDAVRFLRQIGRLKEPPPELVEKVHAFAQDWIDTAKVAWIRVHEMRPEVTRRRDEGSPGRWLAGKNVVLLGAGAIGAVVAEQCVRLGCQNLVIVDDGVVGPGILVRQPYYDRDVGHAKAEALASRLNTITHEDVVTAVTDDCRDLFIDGHSGGGNPFWLSMDSCDLVIDATADAGTRAVLERLRVSQRSSWPPVITMLVGHQATRGLAIVAGAGASSSSHELLRRVAIRGRDVARPSWGDIVDDFFPDPPRTEMFFPEPGCSEPTFTGSASDVMALASTMFGYAIAVLDEIDQAARTPHRESDDEEQLMVSQPPRMRAAGFRIARPGSSLAGRAAVEEMSWDDDLVQLDPTSGLEVRISAEALLEMRSEVRRGARTRGPGVETGGLMLGFFDEASRSVIVDVATGPAPDSLLSEGYFFHGVSGTQDFIDRVSQRTGKLTRFVGIWHCHPYGRAWPSATDEAGITVLTSFTTGGRRALMIILGGSSHRWESWRDGPDQGLALGGHETLPRLFARVVERPADNPSSAAQPPNTSEGHLRGAADADPYAVLTAYQRMLQMPPVGVYYAGGYSDESFKVDLVGPSTSSGSSDEAHDIEE